jgi:N-acetyl-anhydromuramyl-L-alanine amidase AmpD
MTLYKPPGPLSESNSFEATLFGPSPSHGPAGAPAGKIVASQGVAAASATQGARLAFAGTGLIVDKDGMVVDARVVLKRYVGLERGEMKKINGIIVHQTTAAKAQSTFNSYSQKGANGAHFLIDKDGTIYQTASVFRRANHVGQMQQRCIIENRCTPAELSALKRWTPKAQTAHELAKSHPDRYPSNSDSIGIEIVGLATPIPGKEDTSTFEMVNEGQNASLAWLVRSIGAALGVSMKEVFRHSRVGRKQADEASSAKW